MNLWLYMALQCVVSGSGIMGIKTPARKSSGFLSQTYLSLGKRTYRRGSEIPHSTTRTNPTFCARTPSSMGSTVGGCRITCHTFGRLVRSEMKTLSAVLLATCATLCAPTTIVDQPAVLLPKKQTADISAAVWNPNSTFRVNLFKTLPRASRSRPLTIRSLPKAWQRLAWCESRWHLHATSKSGKHHGLWQIHEGWFKSAGVNYKTADVKAQYHVARYVYQRQGARAWTCARQAGLK